MVKKFIDKKKAERFQVVFQPHDPSKPDSTEKTLQPLKGRGNKKPSHEAAGSNRDFEREFDDEDEDEDYDDYEEYDEEEEFTDEAGPSTAKPKVEWELGEYDFPTDGYDYSQHFKSMGDGKFISVDFVPKLPQKANPKGDLFGLDPQPEEEMEEEVDERLRDPFLEQFEDAETVLHTLDADIQTALKDQDEFEELDDDFILQANGGVLPTQGPPPSAMSHMRSLGMREAAEDGEYDDDDDEYDEEYDHHDPDESLSVIAAAARGKEPTLLDLKFDVALEEYNDFEIGGLDDDPNVRGTLGLDQFSNLFDEFLRTTNRTGQEATRIKLPPKPKKVASPPPEEEEPLEDGQFSDADDDDDDTLDTPARDNKKKIAPAPKPKVVIVVQSSDEEEEEEDDDVEKEPDNRFRTQYEVVEEAAEEQWDCESIVSTYSNLENHPRLIVEPATHRIKLSRKTGIPLGVLPAKERKPKQEPPPQPAENLGEARDKEETPEEKKARKKAVKEGRRDQRQNKKALKVAYKTEEARQVHAMRGLLKGTPVVRF